LATKRKKGDGMRIKALISCLLMASAAGLAGVLAQDKPLQEQTAEVRPAQDQPPLPKASVDPQVKRLAQGLIEQALGASHAAEIFAELRRTLAQVYIPIMREMAQGGFPGSPESNMTTATQLAKMLTFMDYLRKLGDELDVALSQHREAMVADFAEQIARSGDESAIGDLRRMLDLSAVRKSMDATYALSKLITGFTYEDSRKLSEFSAWANGLAVDISKALPGADGNPKSAPSAKKVLKAQGAVDELLRLSHLDEMVAAVQRFARDVYAETAPLPGDSRESLIEKIDQFEFLYNMQKAIVLGLAPSVLAASLSDEQLDTLRDYIRTPAFVKAFDLTRNAVNSATAYTKEDVAEARKAFDDLDKKTKLREKSSNEQDQIRKEWTALIEKWRETLRSRIAPETLKGFEQSVEDLQLRDPPI
jgi:hypothetical protein